MSKTPVSVLQEYAAKRIWGMPEYTLISETLSTNSAKFTYRVSLRSMSACGTALSKKEAKHKAAEKLLELLPRARGNHQANATSNSRIDRVADSEHLTKPDNVSVVDGFVNAVGKLNEFCISQKLKTPEFRDSGISGPPHARLFTVVCSVGDLTVKAASNTKKKAKQDAAQSMLDDLVRNSNHRTNRNTTDKSQREIEDKIRSMEILDLPINKFSVTSAESSERAKELFPKLKNYKGTKKFENAKSLNEYHKIFKNTFGPVNCATVRKRLAENFHSATTKEDLLDNIASFLRLNVEYAVLPWDDLCRSSMTTDSFNLSNLPTSENGVIVMASLRSTPPITDAGFDVNYAKAKEKAIANLLASIDIFFT